MNHSRIVVRILKRLAHLKPYIYHRATTGSVYIKFENERLRSVRIGDHKGVSKYRYMWNIDTSEKGKVWEETESGVVRQFFTPDKLEDFFTSIELFAKRFETQSL